jgi:Protein of unknown function (DUF732)
MKLGILMSATLTATVVVPTAVAQADGPDDQFLALVSAQRIPGPPDRLIAAGRAACDY